MVASNELPLHLCEHPIKIVKNKTYTSLCIVCGFRSLDIVTNLANIHYDKYEWRDYNNPYQQRSIFQHAWTKRATETRANELAHGFNLTLVLGNLKDNAEKEI